MQSTIRKIADIFGPRHLVLVAGLIVIMAVLGPFGTFHDFTLAERFGYWALAIGSVGVFGSVIGTWGHEAPRFSGIHPVMRTFASAALATVPGTLAISQLEVSWRGIAYTEVPLQNVVAGVFLISLAAMTVRHGTWRNLFEPHDPAPAPGTAPQENSSAFLERLPRDIGRRLVSLTMQDHYIECVTARGKTLILMRFTDALRELHDYPGLRIHRSHWVAEGTIIHIAREGSRHVATLVDGRKLPVSRTYLDAAREAAKRSDGGMAAE